VQWLQQHDACLEVGREALETGELDGALQQLWAMSRPVAPISSGAEEAAQCLIDWLPVEFA